MRFSILTLAAATLIAVAPAAAVTVTLDFSASTACAPFTCTANDPPTASTYISQTYGDIAGLLDISYQTVAAQGSATPVGANINYWSSGYGDLTDVAWVDRGRTLEVRFTLLQANKRIGFNGVDYAGFGGAYDTTLGLYSLGLSSLASLTTTTSATGHATWNPAVAAQSGGLVFHFGPDAYDSGIDNLSVTISDVPEPASWAMLVIGFGVVGAVSRRRRRAAIA